MDQRRTRAESDKWGFTIIELLVVIAIIAVLAGIFFGVADNVRTKARISRAESDLALLAQYLEQYKAQYGEFPFVQPTESDSPATTSKREGEDGTVALYNALNGLRSIDGKDLDPRQRALIDRGKFQHEFSPSLDPPTPADPEVAPVALLDPWGQAYRYYYKNPANPNTWENPSYVLYSVGPDGAHSAPNVNGYPDPAHQDNIDNLYAR